MSEVVDSIAVSVFADIFIELTNTVSDGKIQITILILRRGALSKKWPRVLHRAIGQLTVSWQRLLLCIGAGKQAICGGLAGQQTGSGKPTTGADYSSFQPTEPSNSQLHSVPFLCFERILSKT